MTIRTRLWASHLIALVLPLLTTLLITAIALAGLYAYIEKGNYIYLERLTQFNTANQIVTYLTWRDLKYHDQLQKSPVAVRLLNPNTTFIQLSLGDTVIYSYGDKKLLRLVPSTLRTTDGKEHTYAENGCYYTQSILEVHNKNYQLCMLATTPAEANDQQVEWYLRVIAFLMFITLILNVWFITYFLTNFSMKHIIRPLRALTKGAKEVAAGNLDTEVPYQSTDEFMPITNRFNAMIRSLKESELERQSQEKSRRELIAGISHDLRTPLTSIRAYVEALRDGIAPTEAARNRYLATIATKTTEIDRLLEQLFLFSKLDIGDEALHIEILNLGQLVREFIRESRMDYAERGLDITLDAPLAVWVRGDATVLVRILENIFTNTLKYKQQERATMDVRVTTQSDSVTITLTDDGPGVKTENLPRLFEVFYRTDKARANTNEGSGLGLAIAAKYLTLMGGTITATNANPHGLCLTITMPTTVPHYGKED